MTNYYEIGGVILDGSYGFDYRKYKRVRRLYDKGEIGMASAILIDHIVANIESVDDIPYSEMQLKVRKWAKDTKTKWRRTLAPLPIPEQVKVPLMLVPTVAEMWSKATGSYDMATPEVRRYEESVHFGGSGGRVI